MDLPPSDSLEQLFLKQVPLLRRAAAHACRRYGMSVEDVQDFTQEVLTKVFVNNYAVLRAWRETSSIETYLVMVVNCFVKDFANKKWGKWRPTKAAVHMGPLATQLEQLLSRDGYHFQEACHKILTEHPGLTTESELYRLAELLPARTPRHRDVPLDTDMTSAPGDGGGAAPRLPPEAVSRERADDRIESSERAHRMQQTLDALEAALQSLSPDDAVIAKLMRDGMKTADIAKTLHLDAKPLYRKIDNIKKHLRLTLEAAGIGTADVADLLNDHDD
jgi:RNA polymerase sigma factor (sigma-70 family)